MQIIGLTGAFGSGKSTAAAFFKQHGFRIVILSSFLEEEAVLRKLPVTREVLQDIGNELREKHGSGILMKMALRNVGSDEKIVIDGLRNLSELEELKSHGGSLVAIVADRNVRYERLKNLKRREKLTPELFTKLDLRDLGVNEKMTGLQTAFCIAYADYFIDSNEGLDRFREKIEVFITKYGK